MEKVVIARPEDFDVQVLYAAAREGKRRVIIEFSNFVDMDKVRREVRAYTSRIRSLVTREYQSAIDNLWDSLLNSDVFVTYFTPGCKAKKCRTFDKYHVVRVIGVLREQGVYKPYSDRKFDALLEQPGKDSPYRRYLSMGLEEKELLKRLREIIAMHKV